MTDNVLIVDDSLTVRMDLAEAFEGAGFRAIPCASLAAAREAASREAVSVAILDIVLPDGDGVELLGELRKRDGGKGIVTVMLSSEAEVKDRIRALGEGADEYVGKPYNASYVVGKARELLEARRTASGWDRSSILVIDDSPTFREALRDALEGTAHEVILAADGEEGLRVAAVRRPTAIIVDGMLPGIDGPTVIRRVRLDAALRKTTCVLLTGDDDRGAELRALDAGADAFVRKGDDMDVILAKVAAAVRTSEASLESATSSMLAPKKILAVDASPSYLRELGDALRGRGYDVAVARSGADALHLLAVQAFDVLLLDLALEGELAAHETCRRVKAAAGIRETPVIMLDAKDDRAAMLESLAAGADDYISKVNDFEVLDARVRAQLRRKQFSDESRHNRYMRLQRELAALEARANFELAETRRELVAELEYKNRELEAYGSTISHDLRAPLRTIIAFSQFVIDDHAGGLGSEGREQLQTIRDAAFRMRELIEDLLRFSRVGRGELHRADVDVTELAREVIAALKASEPGRIVAIEIEEQMTTHADGRLLKAVLENLLGNAWKFTSKTPNACITVRTARRDEETVFEIRDNGAGFDMKYASKLFTPFQRMHSEADFPGTGIGLATIRRIIERHGGRVTAEGTVGAGAVLSFTLPPPRRSSARLVAD